MLTRQINMLKVGQELDKAKIGEKTAQEALDEAKIALEKLLTQ